jgi:hypothetical protein
MKRRRQTRTTRHVLPELPWHRVPAPAFTPEERATLDAGGSVQGPALLERRFAKAAHVVVELDDVEVHCVQHPGRPTWFVVVWPAGARERARAAGRGPEGDVIGSATYVAGEALQNWRGSAVGDELQLDAAKRAVIAHAVVRAVDAHASEVTQ